MNPLTLLRSAPPPSGSQLYVYEASTVNEIQLYSDRAKTVPVSQPVDIQTSDLIFYTDNAHVDLKIEHVKYTGGFLLIPDQLLWDFDQDLYTTSSPTFDNLTVSGDFSVLGTNNIIDWTTINIDDNMIVLNNGEVGTGITTGEAGLKIDRGIGTPYWLLYDEVDDLLKAGEALEVSGSPDKASLKNVAMWGTSPTFNSIELTAAADSTRLKIVGHSVQTSDLINITNSAATELMTLDNAGDLVVKQDVYGRVGNFVNIKCTTQDLFFYSINNDIVLSAKSKIRMRPDGTLNEPLQISRNLVAPATSNLDVDLGSNTGRWDSSYFQNTMDISLSLDANALKIKGFTTQTADLINITNSAATALFVVSGSGDVGIGTDTPSAKLDVVGDILNTSGVELNRSGTATVGDFSISGDLTPDVYFGRLSPTTSDSTNFYFRSRLNQPKLSINTAGPGDITSQFESTGGGKFLVKRFGGDSATLLSVSESTGNTEISNDVSAKSYTGKDSLDAAKFQMVYNETSESIDFNFV